MTMQDPAVDDVENTRRRLMEAMRTGSAQDPTALARDRQEAERRGVSVQTLRAARASGATIPNLNWNTLPDRAPRTTNFLSNPANAAAAHDDVDTLSSVEEVLRTPAGRQDQLDYYRRLNGGSVLQSAQRPNTVGNWLRGLGVGLREGTNQVRIGLSLQLDDAIDALIPEERQPEWLRTGVDQYGRSRNIYQYRQSEASRSMARPDVDGIAGGIYSGVESTLRSAPLLAAAVATRNPTIAVAGAGVTTQAESYGRYRERGGTAQEAFIGATGEGAVESATELLPMGFLVNRFGKDGAKSFIAGTLLREIPSEQAATLAQDAIDTAIANPDKTWADYWAERPEAAAQTAIATLTQTAIMGSASAGVNYAATRLDRDQQVTQAAEQEGSVIDRLNALSEASPLRQRDPQTFQQFIDEAADGTDIEAVYVDAQTFAQSFNAENLTALTEAVPEIAEQLDGAIATGGDIRIPTGAFAAHIAGTEAAAPLLEHLKIDPFAQSRAQAREFLKNQGEELRAEIEAAAAAGQMDEAFVASKDVVRDRVASELDTVGRFSSDVNRAYATVLSDFYAVQAANLGITPEQMAERYPLKFSGELPGGQGRTTLDQAEELDLVHYSGLPGLAESDPSRWGANRTATTREEANRKAMGAPGRTYFGVRGGYNPEGVIRMTSPFEYSARVPAARVYDFDADPQGLRPEGEQNAETASAYEAAIQTAGFGGYRSAQLGGTVAMFEPTPLEMTGAVQTVEEARAVDARMRQLQREERMARVRASVRTDEMVTARPLESFRAQAMAEVIAPEKIYAQEQAQAQPLAGAPKANVPFLAARRAAERYMAEAGLRYDPPSQYVKVDPERAARIAQAFEEMPHDPTNPEVQASYAAMISETLAQWQTIKATGLKVEFIKGDDPYAKSPRRAIDDVRENNHLWVFPTDAGFGSVDTSEQRGFKALRDLVKKVAGKRDSDFLTNNPLLELTDEYIDGVQLRANDVFRIVHDYFGHIKDGNGFRADGEENAWQSHAAMYSPLARRAMTTETRGQNSWVNFGPKAEFNRTASASETVYADQKIGLLPEWVSTEGFLGDTASYAQADVFYSALERAVLNSPTAKAPAAQWKATLAKTPGVKKEELEWSGLNEWLDLVSARGPYEGMGLGPYEYTDAKGNISKEAISAFLRVGGVRLEERVLGVEPTERDRQVWAEGYARDTGHSVEDGLSIWDTDGGREQFISEQENNTEFSNYKLPGADDTYREILLTLPKIEGPSTHWDTENVVAHARITTREDATGARVLFLEEVQSDWHQKGRDEGYQREASQEERDAAQAAYGAAIAAQRESREPYRQAIRDVVLARIAELEAAREEADAAGGSVAETIADQINRTKDAVVSLDAGSDPTIILYRGSLGLIRTPAVDAAAQALPELNLRVTEARVALDALEGGIPDAPFRTSWSTLVMKRMIRYAVDNGFDKVAWINGNQQNGGQTGGDGSFFYERNLVNTTNDLLKKLGGRVEKVDMLENAPGSPRRDLYETVAERVAAGVDPGGYGSLESHARPARHLGIQNGFTITDQMREAAGQGFPLFQDNRGQIAFGADITQTPSVISVLRTADLSTFLHETGHFFLEVTTHIANQADAPAGIKADMGAVFSWFGEGMDLARWNTMTTEERRPYHEQFARGFEAYLFEGRAPSPALRSLFRRFSAWLKNVYKSLTALNVELTDEVRSVFDRMLASADDIRVAEQARSFAPMMTEKPETMSADEWKRYQELGIEATQEAIETLEQRNLRDMQWASNAKSRALRALQREANEQRKAVRAEVTAEVEAEPVNRARAFLRRGVNAEGEQVEGAAKLDIDTMRELYGETGVWTGLKRGGKYGDAGNDGLHPDVVAEMFGFANGESLIEALVNGPNPRDQITGMTDQRMLERYGDLSTPEALERAANEAVANDARLKFLSAEGAALDKAVGRRSILNEAAREYAASVVNRLMLKRLRPAQYLAAQGRAAKAAEQAFRKGDLAAAATAKRNQLVNLHTGRAVQKAQREVEKSMRLFKRIVTANNDALSKSRNMDLVNAARAVLMAHGMGRVKNNAAGYMEAVSKYDPTLFADLNPLVLGATSNALPMENITYEQFVALRDTVSSLWELAKRSRQIEVDGKLVDITVATAAMTERMDAIKPISEQPGQARAVTDRQQRDRDLLGTRAALRRVESWARGLDGADKGPFRTYIWSMISQAADRYRAESNTYIRRFRELLDTVRDDLKPKDIAAPELGYVFGGKSELYHALLHTGNGSNKSKLLLGRKWGRKNEDGSLDDTRWQAFIDRLHTEGVLAQKDWTFVQAVWDLMEETKPGAQKAHRQVYGRYFDEIAADPVDTPFGQLRGGYVPAMTDAFLVQDAALRAEQEAIEGGDSAMFPAASNGFTKSRVEDYTRELALDLRLLPMHIDKVLKFTHLGPPVRDVARVLKSRGFSARLAAFDPTAQTDLLLPWLQRAAKQIVQTQSKGRAGKAADRFFSVLRQRVGMQLMFGNVLNTAQQLLTGWAPAMLRVGKGPMGAALWRFLRNPADYSKQATELSLFLKNRAETDVFEARQQIAQLTKLNPNVKDQFVDFVTRHTYFMQTAVQNVMDMVIWGAAYDQATQRGDTQADAVRFADSVIRETQGSMAPEDISRFETGTPFVRMFTQFAGYFNLMANLNATEVQIVARDTGLRNNMGRLWYIYLMGFAIPALIGDAVMKIGRGGWEDEEDDGYMDDLLAWFFSSQAKFALAAVPVVGQAANAALATFNDKPYDDRISMSPAVSVLEGGLKTPSEAYQTLVEGESFNQSDTRNALNLLGILTGTPTGVLAKPIGYGAGVAAGDVEPTGPVDAVRGAVTGAASPASKQ